MLEGETTMAMEYTRLGETGLEISRLCLGCAAYSGDGQPLDGWEWTLNDEDLVLDIIDRAIEAGITFIDTSNLYSLGDSERLVGKAIEGRRDDLVIATKVGKPLGDAPNTGGLSRRHVIEQAEASLERLGTDYIDLYQIHMWDIHTPIEETLSALDYLVNEGLVRYIGASNLTGWQCMKALYTSDLEDLARFVSVQPEYNLVGRQQEQSLLPVARDQGVGVIPYAPVAAGFLTGVYDRDSDAAGMQAKEKTYRDLSRYDTEANWQVLDEIRALADQKDATPVQISLAWLLHKDLVDAPIIGPRTVGELEEYLGALDISLTDDEMERLEAPVDPVWSDSKLNW